MSDTLRCDIQHDVAIVTLARAERSNAFNDVMIAELTSMLAALAQNGRLRALVLQADGAHFCAGLDYEWLLRASEADQHRNFEDALALSRLLQLLDRMTMPTIACVQGSVLGIGVGIVACCDLVVARQDSDFQLAEVRFGLVPAVTAPYLQARLGRSAMRRYVLTAETLPCAIAKRLGLVHEVVEDEVGLARQRDRWLSQLARNGPQAMAAAKRLLAVIEHRPIDDTLLSDIAHRIAHLRTRPEAREGVAAHVQGRAPRWVAGGD
ncbi:enoyl-CoA hydratase-related protein [Chitinolyticbacter meiyuanensis]|uniref:enoyl-CoA hydratase-related protein n=1 Tax=Chitinolyticbacter meiyuanensis TaxID=682798 RepID=UPI0011E5A69F|nr:enoyl-CoA hydratase-related protein [Chitinolyticbacter meiyuanensis]